MSLTDLEARQLISRPKFVRNWSGFKKRDNHAGHVIGSAIIVDENGISIPGVTIDIEVKAPVVVVGRCLVLFTLRKRDGKNRPRIFQLEVCPRDKRSHNGLTTLYGPHEHILEEEPTSVVNSEVHCEDWTGCFSWFLQRINLGHFEVDEPC